MRFGHEAAPVRVNERMALTSVDLLSSIVTAWPAGLGGHATRLTELIGREEELEILLRRWSKAKTGKGEVGIGKSRLTAALLERLATERHTRLRYFVLRSTRTARSIPSSARRNVLLDWRTMILRKRSSTSSMPACADFDPYPGRGALCRDALAAE
jgi:hypothetical protein